MTYLSKPQAFLTDKAKELVGRTVVCQRDAGAGYFTKDKEYEIHMDATGCPYIFNDFGGHCHQSASTFVLKQLPLTPKQPKVGEVWCFRPAGDDYNKSSALYHVLSVKGGKVSHRTIGGTQALYEENVKHFLEEHTFVF